MAISPRLTFHDGRTIPQLGYGVWQVDNDTTPDVVRRALEIGYRHIDTAQGYGNEEGVGAGLRDAGIDREDVFITTKVANEAQGYDTTMRTVEESMQRLGIDELDLFLIHSAQPSKGLYLETWKAFIELQQQGRIRSIGVSNFPTAQLDHIIAETGVTPVLNQIELHPYFNQAALRRDHAERQILTEAWSPLGQGGDLLRDPVLTEIAGTHDATVAQVAIAWSLAIGNVVIPKSVTPERIQENFDALELTLTDEEVEAINGLDNGGRIGQDPAAA